MLIHIDEYVLQALQLWIDDVHFIPYTSAVYVTNSTYRVGTGNGRTGSVASVSPLTVHHSANHNPVFTCVGCDVLCRGQHSKSCSVALLFRNTSFLYLSNNFYVELFCLLSRETWWPTLNIVWEGLLYVQNLNEKHKLATMLVTLKNVTNTMPVLYITQTVYTRGSRKIYTNINDSLTATQHSYAACHKSFAALSATCKRQGLAQQKPLIARASAQHPQCCTEPLAWSIVLQL